MTPQRFWMIWVQATPKTNHRHPTYEQARQEADRLAMLPENYGKNVYILQAVDYRKYDGMPKVDL